MDIVIDRLHKNHLGNTGRGGGYTFYQLNQIIQIISITNPKYMNVVFPNYNYLDFMVTMIKDLCAHYKLPLLRVKNNEIKIGQTIMRFFSEESSNLRGLSVDEIYHVS